MLAILVVVLVRSRMFGTEPLPWAATAAAAVMAISIFATERRIQGFFWGVVAAGAMALHPSLRHANGNDWSAFLSEAAVGATLGLIAIGWQLAFLPRLAWRVWPFVLVGLGVLIGLAWAGEVRAGVFAAALAATALLTVSLLVRGIRAGKPETVPGLLNMFAAATVALLAPALGVFILRLIDASASAEEQFWAPLLSARQTALEVPAASPSWAQLNRWFWPTIWITGPMMGWALWRSSRRGWSQWKGSEPPTFWLLPFFVALVVPAVFIWPLRPPEAIPLTLSALIVLLAVCAIADGLRSLLRRLMLPPPSAGGDNTKL
ncbi:MAG: hypothetical protein K2R98_05110 [Gemmataceae bacterium]|nr:hypothetical protein [Gemmataceae bacterium]